MLLSAKVPHLARLALEHVHERNMAVVIGLQSNGREQRRAGHGGRGYARRGGGRFRLRVPAGDLRNLIAKQFPITSTKSQLEADAERTRWRRCTCTCTPSFARWKQLPTVAQTADKTRKRRKRRRIIRRIPTRKTSTRPPPLGLRGARAEGDQPARGRSPRVETIGDSIRPGGGVFLEKRNVNEATERARRSSRRGG